MLASRTKPSAPHQRADLVAQSDLVQAFVQRAQRAATLIAQHMPRERLIKAVAAPTDTDALLLSMQEPAAIAAQATVPAPDPLAAALLRGAQIKRALLRRQRTALGLQQLADHLGISVPGLTKKRDRGQVFWLPVGEGYVYPAFQVGSDGLLPGVREVLAALGDPDPWVRVNFMLTGDARLGGARPIDVLHAGQVDAVVRAARDLGSDGA